MSGMMSEAQAPPQAYIHTIAGARGGGADNAPRLRQRAPCAHRGRTLQTCRCPLNHQLAKPKFGSKKAKSSRPNVTVT